MGKKWPLVGRADELERAIELSAEGGVLLVGSAGVGKSRLAAEVMERSGAVRKLRVRATRAAATMPLGAFAQVLAAHGATTEIVDATRLGAAGEVLVAGLGRQERLALWVDDVHSLDDTSAMLLTGLATDDRVELVLTMRSGTSAPEPVTVLWRDELVGRLDVEPLERPAVVELLELALPGGVDGLAAAELADACVGNLLYLRELVAGLERSGRLALSQGRWFLQGPISAPPQLAELIEQRLSQLSVPAQRLLEAAAFAEPFGVGRLEASGQGALVDELVAAGLLEIVVDGRRRQARAAHPLHMEVARARMGGQARRRLLGELVDTAEAVGMRRRDDARRVAAWQLDAGRRADPAVLVAAAGEALLGSDLIMAERFAAAALDAEDTALAGAAAHLLGSALDDQGRCEEAERIFADAASAAVDEDHRAMLAMARASVLLRGLNRPDEAVSVLDELEPTLRSSRLIAELHAQRASNALCGGDVERVIELTRSLLTEGDERAYCEGALQASVAYVLLGRATMALEVARRAFETRVALGEQVQLAGPGLHLVSLAFARIELGRVDEAIGSARFAYAEAVAQRDRHGQAWTANILARALLVSGRLVESSRYAREAAVVFGELGHPNSRWGFGAIALAAGQIGDAATAADAIAELSAEPDTSLVMMDAELHRARGWAAVAAGREAAALEHFELAASHARGLGQFALEAAAVHDAARLGAGSGGAVRIRELAEVVDGELMAARRDHVIGVATRDGDRLFAASERFGATGAHLFAAESAALGARLLRDSGQERRAAECASAASRSLAHCESPGTPALRDLGAAATLTRREREVATLAASGRSNRQIADELVVSVRTVENHLQRVYAKLGLGSRDQLGPVLGSR